jgi:hypothetical protein
MAGMAGMAERQKEWSNGGNGVNGGNGRNGGTAERMAELQNGRNAYVRTIYGTHRRQRHSNLLYYR